MDVFIIQFIDWFKIIFMQWLSKDKNPTNILKINKKKIKILFQIKTIQNRKQLTGQTKDVRRRAMTW